MEVYFERDGVPWKQRTDTIISTYVLNLQTGQIEPFDPESDTPLDKDSFKGRMRGRGNQMRDNYKSNRDTAFANRQSKLAQLKAELIAAGISPELLDVLG